MLLTNKPVDDVTANTIIVSSTAAVLPAYYVTTGNASIYGI